MKKCFGVLGWFSPNGTGINPIPRLAISEMHNGQGDLHRFSGILLMSPDGASFIGETEDRDGVSSISGIFHGSNLSFKKTYLGRPGIKIFYELSLQPRDPLKEGSDDSTLYVGHYRGDSVDEGQCRLVLTPVSPKFFESKRAEDVPLS